MSISADTLRKLAALRLDPEQMAGVLDIVADLAQAEEARLASSAARTRLYRQRGGDQIPPHIRAAVFERDNATCQECGSKENPQVDHIHPVSKGGSSDLENLQILCRPCNARKRDRVRKRNSAEFRGIPPSDKEKSPTPPKEINSPRETKPARGARLPTDWALPAAWGRWALDQGHSEATIRLEADKFRDFWCSKAGKDGAKLDWEATWRNWMRNVPKSRGAGASPPHKPKSEFQQHQDDCQRELDIALGRIPKDEYAGHSFDLDQRDWRSH